MHLLRLAACFLLTVCAAAEPPTRAEAVALAKALAEHRWQAAPAHALHGPDARGIAVHTPDGEEPGRWQVGTNVGVPYKWGGFDTAESFEAGLRAGKKAGDLYSAEKRRLGGKAVSAQTVGLDCSGLVSRCWRLPKKHATSTLGNVSTRLPSADELRPGDVMNQPGGHVLLFARWLDEARQRALFYEAEPFSKVRSTERTVAELADAGFTPLRYRKIRE